MVLGRDGSHVLRTGLVEGVDPLASFSQNAPRHLLRTDSFPHAPDVLVNSFYDGETEEGCAFEELISFHGGMGGPQTRAFLMHPVDFRLPDEPLVGAEAVNAVLRSCRRRHHVSSISSSAPSSSNSNSTLRSTSSGTRATKRSSPRSMMKSLPLASSSAIERSRAAASSRRSLDFSFSSTRSI